ncbi:MAG: FAD-dependent oxidoreductase [Pseudomonadota bacterium]
MKIAIVGTGIAGMTAAHLLNDDHDITVYETNKYIGGHSNTVVVEEDGHEVPIDTGFIVLNDWTYPNFENLLEKLGINTIDSEMSFSAKCEKTKFEWSGESIKGLILNKDNWKAFKSYQIAGDVIRFNKIAKRLLAEDKLVLSLGEFLDEYKFSQAFINYYILPMGAAIWSTSLTDIRDYPAKSFLSFFNNHGLLNINKRPQWKTVVGGSKEYVKKLVKPFLTKIKLNAGVTNIVRQHGKVVIHTKDEKQIYDHVFIACHSDQAMKMLEKPSTLEHETLNNIKFNLNIATLHTDSSLMPSRKGAWSSWNYLVPENSSKNVKVTYYMNRLQSLKADNDYFVSLNMDDNINPEKVIKTIEYMHPFFDKKAIDAQKSFPSINGTMNTWYCGAYWRHGFHEDGVWSAIQAVERFNERLNNEELYLQRAS